MAGLRFTDLQSRPMEFLDFTSVTLGEFQIRSRKVFQICSPHTAYFWPCCTAAHSARSTTTSSVYAIAWSTALQSNISGETYRLA